MVPKTVHSLYCDPADLKEVAESLLVYAKVRYQFLYLADVLLDVLLAPNKLYKNNSVH